MRVQSIRNSILIKKSSPSANNTYDKKMNKQSSFGALNVDTVSFDCISDPVVRKRLVNIATRGIREWGEAAQKLPFVVNVFGNGSPLNNGWGEIRLMYGRKKPKSIYIYVNPSIPIKNTVAQIANLLRTLKPRKPKTTPWAEAFPNYLSLN